MLEAHGNQQDGKDFYLGQTQESFYYPYAKRRAVLMIKRLVNILILVFGLLIPISWADTYNGSLTYGDGLTGAAPWNTAELSWTVDNTTNPGLWTYKYIFNVGAKDISYVIMGVWKSFTSESINHGTTSMCELGTFGQQGKSAPGIPGDIYGLKCTPKKDSLTYTWSIVTDRAPRWNGFYAKSGKHKKTWVFAYNTGFGTEPSNPTIADGNNRGWVLSPGMTFHEQTVHDFAIDRFLHIRNIVAPEDETKPEAKFIGHHIEVASEKWIYILDDTGQQIFRPQSMFNHIERSLAKDITPFLSEWLEMKVPQSTVDEAKRISLATLAANYMGDVSVHVSTKRELIGLKNLDVDMPLTHHEGRTRVLFRPETPDTPLVERIRTQLTYDNEGRPIIQAEEVYTPLRSHETGISFAQGRVVRIDSVFLTQDALAVVDLFRDGLMNGNIKAFYLQVAPMVLGTFFQKDEWRFPFSAHTWEGEDFITTSEPDCIMPALCNPYDYEPIPYCTHLSIYDDPRVIFEEFRRTNAYRHEYWYRWQHWGRRNGVRGNCEDFDELTQTCLQWEKDNWKIKHNNLGNYQVICPDPNIPLPLCLVWITNWILCTGEYQVCPGGNIYTMEDKFYEDLEDCHVAMLTAHGGPANNINYQFEPYRDIWAFIHTAGLDGLGKGNLRHLFLASCAGMNWHHEEPFYLEQEWLNNHVANGIRSIFGTDGAYFASPFDEGLIFFRYYHSGDSVSDSWANMALTINTNNVPVGVGYGNNPFDALSSLLDQRFTRERAGNACAAVLALVN
jgi:hypothetical protein